MAVHHGEEVILGQAPQESQNISKGPNPCIITEVAPKLNLATFIHWCPIGRLLQDYPYLQINLKLLLIVGCVSVVLMIVIACGVSCFCCRDRATDKNNIPCK